ncbi:Plasmodium vivax Vir protein, putative [Plasmodium vivax]|nr:Plasmodium vivax Vir protein, putative [Plasmodium vivax]
MADLEKVLSLLPSRFNYEKLEGYSELGLKTQCSELKKDMDFVTDFYNICMNITGVLDFLEYLSFNILFDKNKCTIFALWMYDYLIKNFNDGHEYKKTKAVINKMNPLFLKYSKKIGCEIPSYINIEKHVDNLKTLYDYATNYDTLLQHIINNEYKCSEDFSNYIEGKVKLIKEVMIDCDHSSQKHCEVYKKIFGQSIDEKFSTLQCTKVGSQQINKILDAKLERQSTQEENVEISVLAPLDSINPKGISHVQETEVQIATNEIPSTNINVMRTTLPVVGSAFTMSLLYRFTPVGSWISNRLRGNGRRSHNLNNITYGPQGDLTDPHTLDSLRNQFNISYRPV